MLDIGLSDVHVLVTGASGGIGYETAKLFLDQGAKVTAHFNTSAAAIDILHNDYGGRVNRVQADLSVETDVNNMYTALKGHPFGHVQVLIVNHGVWPSQDVPIKDMTLDQWNSTLGSNLTSTFLAVRGFLKGVEQISDEERAKVAVIFVGSTAGKYGEAGHADYAANKSAMMYGLLLSLKNEIVKIAPKGRVNCVAPGWVKTPMAAEALKNPDTVYRAMATTPLKKVAESGDVANQIMVLSSSVLSGHITGQVVMVEGGMEGRLLNFKEDF